ncbi:MAG: 2-oxoacid:ferredoxin oxidoreductase subunit beta [Gammaproteobacteria bacterium TMED95]|jgi:2-oxoglutarate ferredoxin oxidoreductase subunit beta|nr:2-oxoacid:ferredoxin oxidoreductase subunit beta [Gammaproteobacteria bacterium]OUV20193.1 MAG: 2-oxoacid:ferredoxin oxidoreductase subunit beta [Gammaproteobacteria bacterium TMED95]|tara:strand:- start:87 stop:1103 length:1017 start_codon:yes stop_codon:yes gene_type:complete
MNAPQKLTLKDFSTDQEVRWCPGCGDYAILKTIQKLMPEIDTPKENTVFVSGIGCSSRFPYYMETYGFHTIHGRAPSIATGVKLANPELDVWVVTGDGDGLSIGGNHMLHVLRRNVDLQILLFNNEIYGLTKGQYSPTSKVGTRSPSTPDGSLDMPLRPCTFALGAGARFVARTIDTEAKHMTPVLKRAHAHKGASFVEIYQNCPVYNDGIFDYIKEKKTAAQSRLLLEHGQPLVFGTDNSQGLRLNAKSLQLEVVTIGEDGVTLDDIVVHDETNRMLATMLAGLSAPDFPEAVGVLFCQPETSYESSVYEQIKTVREKKGIADFNAVLRQGHTWTVG